MFLTHTYRYKLIGAFIIQISLSMHASLILQGDSSIQSKSFTHPIKEYAMGIEGQFYVAAHEVGAKNFAIAVAGPHSPKFLPLAPRKSRTRQ